MTELVLNESRGVNREAFIDFIVLYDAKLKVAEDGGKREIVAHLRKQIGDSFKRARQFGFFANEIEVGVNDCLEKVNRFWFFPETAQERNSFDEIVLVASDIQGAEKHTMINYKN